MSSTRGAAGAQQLNSSTHAAVWPALDSANGSVDSRQAHSHDVQRAMQRAMQKVISGMSLGFSQECVEEILSTLRERVETSFTAEVQSDAAFKSVIERAYRVASKFDAYCRANNEDEDAKSFGAALFSTLTIVCALVEIPLPQDAGNPILAGLGRKLEPILDGVDSMLQRRS